MSRTASSLRNMATAFVGQAAGIVISFFARIIFLRCLNTEYLGLNGLFTNILTIFSLVELGVGPAMNFSLYKPLANHDVPKIKSLMALYKKAYITIGCAIAVIGVIFTPFYTVFMDSVPDIPYLTVIYWLFTANTVISYFFSYKRALIICDEKRYIATIYRYVFYFFLNIAQMAFLLITHNYIVFLILQVLFTFAENVGVSVKADKMYPYLKEKNIEPVPKETKQGIKKYIGAMVIHKVGGMIVFSSDNLVLSRFVGLVSVGLYSNYYLIINALNTVFAQIFTSMTASVGNLNAQSSDCDKNSHMENVFNKIFFVNFWIYGFSACCLWVLFNPFISLWLGENLLFDKMTVLAIVISFYLTGMRKTGLTYMEATGSFYYNRFVPPVEIVINIAASIILAKQIGAAGVFWGTAISTVATCLWVEPYVLYKHVFHDRLKKYANRFLTYTIVSIVVCAVTSFVAGYVHFSNIFLSFIIKIFICLLIPNILFFLIFHKREEFSYLVELGKNIIYKVRNRKK